MKYLENQLMSIKDEDLSPEEKIKKKHFKKLAKLLSYIPIEDSHNFKKVYDLYKVPYIKIH